MYTILKVRTIKRTASLIPETEIATDKCLHRSQICLSSAVLLSTVNLYQQTNITVNQVVVNLVLTPMNSNPLII